MELEIRLFATFRATVGQKTLYREFPDGTTVGDVLGALEAEFEGLEGEFLDGGDTRDQLSVLKNGREVLHMAGVDTVLEDGDRLSVFPPVAGGDSTDASGRDGVERSASVEAREPLGGSRRPAGVSR